VHKDHNLTDLIDTQRRRCPRIEDLVDDLYFKEVIAGSQRTNLAAPALLGCLTDSVRIGLREATVRFDHIQEKLGQIWNMTELTRSSLISAEAGSHLDEGGVWYPDDRPFLALRGEMPKWLPEAYQLLGSNPLPDTFRVTPDQAGNLNRVRDAIVPAGATGRRAPADPSIDEVKNRRDETSKILSATRIVKLTMALLAALLIAASILLISNTIKLSLFARRREVEVMKLVGATDWFIRWPFVIEGVIVGALGGGLAILLLAVGKVALIDPLARDFALIAAPSTIDFTMLVAVLLAASVAVSATGSALSLRRFLRV